MTETPAPALPSPEQLDRHVALALDAARAGGATQAEASVSASRGLSVSVRKGEVESLEFQQDRDLGITVYIGHRKGNASTGDLSDAGIRAAVQAALDIARATGEDPCNGLADAERMARVFPDLDLDHPWDLDATAAIDLAAACEAAAFAADPRVSGSEGASVSSHRGVSVYANTHGFLGHRSATHHSIGCAVVAGRGEAIQRDYWYSSARCADDLMEAAAVGRKAGLRAAARLGARKLGTCTAPVLFPPELARGLWGHLISAMSGGALYRKASFLLGRLGQPVCAPQVTLLQRPLLPRGAGSAAYDNEGVATQDRTLVERGVLQGWLLGSYSARKLGLSTTGNAGGVFNLIVEPGTDDFEALLRRMDRGLLLCELLGQGVNLVTGDYSRGAAGFWVEHGEIAYPVEELTIAGNLADMFRHIVAIGCDVDTLHNVRTGSVLIERMTIAGH
ncbi:microcin-processing peptidase 1. Unknown type peptidase. MEROPS family U62 [Fontimonas thermophila]|uniref:PmbA protein n=1 Tax=Fontimonas thermophila TaxID=1076937 RepID=A0A1I2I935_9GAMM|nr:metalloprotease PmbA [Fontimonas thermophila]SFF38889.1 microcin-processing peptidase 1. Unknown type peptidase. MEROPS family U62 [Fontimonas thermophila]